MKREGKQELIDGIKAFLQEQEEPYELGAWEMFQHQTKKKRRAMLWWRAGLGTAASLLLLVSFTLLLKDEITPPSLIVDIPATETEQRVEEHQYKGQKPPPGTPADPDQPADGALKEGQGKEGLQPVPAAMEDAEVAEPVALPEILPVHSPVVARKSFIEMPPEVKKKNVAAAKWKQPAVPFPVAEKNKQSQDLFTIGVAYAPGWNSQDVNQQLNMSGGILADWNFKKKLALSSGLLLAQNQLAYQGQESMNRTMAAGTETFVEVDLLSLEIPLNLRYYLTDKLSFSAGISSAAFLKEDYRYEHISEREVQVLTLSGSNEYEPVSYKVTVTEVEQASQPSFHTAVFAGFYNFSFGYRYELSEKYSFGVEPFVKIPTGRIRQENLQYSRGGLQLNFSF